MAKFYGIGVGPGDENLLTIKAAEVLSTLDMLLIPVTKTGKTGVAHRIVEKYIKEETEQILIEFVMLPNRRLFEEAAAKAAVIIREGVAAGKNIGFVTLGDPSVYSTYGYLVKALQGSGVEIETIPGITSFCAVAAAANRPLVEKDELLCIVPMGAPEEHIDALLRAGEAFAFMKFKNHEELLTEMLDKHGLKEEALLVRRCGFPEQELRSDVTEALAEDSEYLSVVISRK